jgi:NhaP-type Na+/H+ or K+/H+ antiporter
VNAIIMMICIKVVLGYDDTYYTWTGAFMFGSIVSCTDPIAVLAQLKEIGGSPKFNTLLEGESLLNDATGYLLII